MKNEMTSFFTTLKASGFQGEYTTSSAECLIAATDNSIYQLQPSAILYPRTKDDLVFIAKAADKHKQPFTVRGGGTGTNAQSLTADIVVDVSRYLDRILSFDPETEIVTVQPGVILSRLNAYLKPLGYFFPPTVSTATRATIGGMIATDASGKGSRIYGKTSDYLHTLDLVLSNGEIFKAKHFNKIETDILLKGTSRAAKACRKIINIIQNNADEIESVFPKMNRGLTGYNLQRISFSDGSFNPMRLLAGSEGTLALTQEVSLKVRKLPRFKRLIVIRYSCFDAALEHINTLLKANPLAIEILDDRVLDTARDDVSWKTIGSVLGEESDAPVKGLNFVEFTGDDLAEIEQGIIQIKECSTHETIIDLRVIEDDALINQLWTLRTAAVGLLGRPLGDKQAIPFIEDTAVPPESLRDYVKEFRAVLDQYHLTYGMFGHADVGCLHVRPFINMLSDSERALIRPLSEKIAVLTKKYGGLLWGEHGRGVRGEFLPFFFGEKLFSELHHIKAAFDPDDLLNRGKLVSLQKASVIKIDEMPFRGVQDEQIASDLRKAFSKALNCNGNGACFNQESNTIMCPSYKATKDRLQSPKGRTALLKEWLRLTSLRDSSTEKKPELRKKLKIVEKTLKSSLSSCLACKACASQCPLKVDIPALRSLFWQKFYRFRVRPIKDYMILFLEYFLAWGRRFPRLMTSLLQSSIVTRILKGVGLVDLPTFSPPQLPSKAFLSSEWLDAPIDNKVLILQDSYTGSFEGNIVEDTFFVLQKLGYDVRVSPVWQNGKACHVLGFRKQFSAIAQKIIQKLRPIADRAIPIISLDAATGLMFQKDYQEVSSHIIPVMSLEQFLSQQIQNGHLQPGTFAFDQTACSERSKIFLPHCTAQALTPESSTQWRDVLAFFGLKMTIKQVGCCGMAGLFGHEKTNAFLSRKIFDLNWSDIARNNIAVDDILVAGFSCRCQTKRIIKKIPQHPVQYLRNCIEIKRDPVVC